MDARVVLSAIGAGVTTFFVAVSVIEVLDTAFSAIVGLPAGLLAGMKGTVVVE